MWMKLLKGIFCMGAFFGMGYYYAVITKGTVFDNFFIMLISFFLLIFLVNFLASYIKKKIADKQAEKEIDGIG